jgi:hypothetical protein
MLTTYFILHFTLTIHVDNRLEILQTDFLLVSWVIRKHSFSGLGVVCSPLKEGGVGLLS